MMGGQRYSLALPPGKGFICVEIIWLVFVDISSFSLTKRYSLLSLYFVLARFPPLIHNRILFLVFFDGLNCNETLRILIFIGLCIVMYSYSTINKMHLLSQIIYSCKTLCMFRTVFPSIIRSSNLRIQQWHMSDSCCYRGWDKLVHFVASPTASVTVLILNVSIPIVQPTRYTRYLKLFILVKRCMCFRRSYRPSSGAQNCVYSNGICRGWDELVHLIPDSSR
jgi:hypothetical protein